MSIVRLFDSNGINVANALNGQLHSPSGPNIGHLLATQNIFIDMKGKYLGEIALDNRLLYNSQTPFKNQNFGNQGNFGNIGNYGNPGNQGRIALPFGFTDVELD